MAAATPLTPQIVIDRPEHEVARIEHLTDPLVVRAGAISIDSDTVYEQAAAFLRDCKAMQKDIKDTLEPAIHAAHVAHKEMTSVRARLLEPVVSAEKVVKGKMARFVEIQERAAREEQRRAEQAARAAEEERRLREAEHLEAAGEAEAAEAVLDAPIVTPSVRPQAAPPKAAGVSTRKKYRAKVVDLEALIRAAAEQPALRAYLVPNQQTLDAVASSLKEGFSVPGVELDVETIVSAQGR